jgi:hypothetical protein
VTEAKRNPFESGRCKWHELRRLGDLAHRDGALASGEPAELAIRADIEVPERKLAVTWSLRRNTDKSLPDVPLPRWPGLFFWLITESRRP